MASVNKLTSAFIPLFAVVVTIVGAISALAENRPLAKVLESSNKDLILVTKGNAPEYEAVSESEKDKDRLGADIKQRLVIVCLQNAATRAGVKAFDIRNTNQPRYVAQPGKKICGKFEPTRHTVYFWKTGQSGKLQQTLTGRLSLEDTDGTQINMTWVRD